MSEDTKQKWVEVEFEVRGSSPFNIIEASQRIDAVVKGFEAKVGAAGATIGNELKHFRTRFHFPHEVVEQGFGESTTHKNRQRNADCTSGFASHCGVTL